MSAVSGPRRTRPCSGSHDAGRSSAAQPRAQPRVARGRDAECGHHDDGDDRNRPHRAVPTGPNRDDDRQDHGAEDDPVDEAVQCEHAPHRSRLRHQVGLQPAGSADPLSQLIWRGVAKDLHRGHGTGSPYPARHDLLVAKCRQSAEGCRSRPVRINVAPGRPGRAREGCRPPTRDTRAAVKAGSGAAGPFREPATCATAPVRT